MIGLSFIRHLLRISLILCSAGLIYSCNGGGINQRRDRGAGIHETIVNAEKFMINKASGHSVVTIFNPWQGAVNIKQVFHLIKRGDSLPKGLDSSEIIFVPVKNIICMSTSYVAMISVLGETNTITAVSGPELIFDEIVSERIRQGYIADVGYEENLNKELILKTNPDLIMMYGIGNESSGYTGKISELGVKVLFNADYLEIDPLKKAEWIKLFGALYCKEKLADSIYYSEVADYNKLKSYINKTVVNHPRVLLGLPYRDAWYISPGNSYINRLIEDAGGEYLWKDKMADHSMPLGIENVYIEALKADYWLNIGSATSKQEISVVDNRLEDLPCFREGKLFNNNKRITERGGNDYWESGTVYPHLILKDIAILLHPELFSDSETLYYRKIE